MKKNILGVIVVIVIIALAGGAYYFWPKPKGASAPTPAELQEVLNKLSKHIILPVGETPEVGRIDNPDEAVKAQPFVKGAQAGDLLLVYVKAAKAIVYSPSRDLIVNVGPVSVNPEATPAETPQTPKTDN
jgi:hypothetical protein